MIHKAPALPIASPPPDQDAASGKGVGPLGSVELGRAKYWNGNPELCGDDAAVPLEDEGPAPAHTPSYFREAMTGYAEPAEPFDPVPRP